MEIKDFKVGQTVYLEPANNQLRMNNKEIRETKILTVGKKYLTVEGYGYSRMKFGIVNNSIRDISNYCANYYLHTDLQKIQDEKLEAKLRNKVKEHKFTFEELKKINELFF